MRYPTVLNTALLFVVSAVCAIPLVSADTQIDALSDRAADFAIKQQAAGIALADKLWGLAELGYLEYQSSAELQTYLGEHGFAIEAGVGGIPTAFAATFHSGTAAAAGPVVALAPRACVPAVPSLIILPCLSFCLGPVPFARLLVALGGWLIPFAHL